MKKKGEVINEEPAPTTALTRKRSLEVIDRLTQPKNLSSRKSSARVEEPLA
jgi:hypothetical protein